MDITLPDNNKKKIYLYNNIDDTNISTTITSINEYNNEYFEFFSQLNNYFNNNGLTEYKFIKPTIELYLTTFGGNCYDGLALCSVLKQNNVKVICNGYIMSMGIPILLSCSEKIAYENTTFMIHSISSICMGKINDMKEDFEQAKHLQNVIDDIILNNSYISKDELAKCHIEKKDWYMTAKEALKFGLIDKII